MRASKIVKISLFVGLCLCVGVRADLMRESPLDFDARTLVCAFTDLTSALRESPADFQAQPPVCQHTDFEAQITDTTVLARSLNVTDLYPSHFLPESKYDLDEPAPVQPPQTLSDSGQSSLSLCLSALISLGLFSSIHRVNKLSFGFVLHYYHNGGPFQVGHSIAVDLDSLCPIPVCCFVQPVHAPGIAHTRHFGTVVSLWRKSQFTPDVIVTRGPPLS